ncbi:pleckstrin homology domain-containing family f member 1 [Stylonychia lemnae]|uniref:Pleckstrin homology domain-containing family f member 1 n=1 Tax=Stylonychia lemnae TaxID=5949 RepID=A0A078ABN8_STYLE|nr:pleckstrin homology domain-containing family f member 1 [Stylonychia lemnae]|eukprot:CDW79286.1 pleckstrin homology domain-containing family f member 1 [Stylonychia lemnae]
MNSKQKQMQSSSFNNDYKIQVKFTPLLNTFISTKINITLILIQCFNQVLVKDGLNIKSRIDQNGIFKIKQPTSQEMTMADTTGHSNHIKRSINNNENQNINNNENRKSEIDQRQMKILSQNNQAYNKFFNVTSLLDKLTRKGVATQRRQETASSLKIIFQDIMVENLEQKTRLDKFYNNSSESANDSSASRIKEKNTAGSIIDNFGSAINTDDAQLLEQISRLQAKVWSLQSENDLLNQKMIQMIQSKEQKDHQMKTINKQIEVLLQEAQPKGANGQNQYLNTNGSNISSHKNNSGLNLGGASALKSPQSHKEREMTFQNQNFSSKSNQTQSDLSYKGGNRHQRGKYSGGQIPHTHSNQQFNNLLSSELDAIESDKEGEDFIQSSINKKNLKMKTTDINEELFENNDLFGYGNKNNNKYEETKENLRYQHIFDTTDNFEDQDHKQEEQNLSSEDYDSDHLINNIKKNIDQIRKITTSSGRPAGVTPGYHMRRKSKYALDQHRQESRSFKEAPGFNLRSKSFIRTTSGMGLGIDDNMISAEQNFLTTNFGVNPPALQQVNHTPSRSGSHMGRSGSEAPYSQSAGTKRFGRSVGRDNKFEPKSTWEPNEQGDQCKICNNKFSILKRKHHCRKCGLLVCASCSGNNWYVPGYADQKVRMCDSCYKEWMAYKVSAHNINKTSVFSSYFGNNQIQQTNS